MENNELGRDVDQDIVATYNAFLAISDLTLCARHRATTYLYRRTAEELNSQPLPEAQGHRGKEATPAYRKVFWSCSCGWHSDCGVEGSPFPEAEWRMHVASTTEAGTAETAETGSVHDGAVPKEDALPNPSPQGDS